MHSLVRQTAVPGFPLVVKTLYSILWPGSFLRLGKRIQDIAQSIWGRDTCVWTQIWMLSPFPVLHNILTTFVPPCPFWGMTQWVCSVGSKNLFPDIAKKGTTNGNKPKPASKLPSSPELNQTPPVHFQASVPWECGADFYLSSWF